MSETHVSGGAKPIGWREGLALWSALLAFLIWLFFEPVSAMVMKWWESESFTHALLIIPISIWLAAQRWNDVRAVPVVPSKYGLIAIAAAGVVWMLGWLGDVLVIQQFAFVFMVQASFLAVMGMTATRAMAFPLFYLLFAVPFGLELVPMLQQITAAFVVKAIELSGIPVFLDGIYISIPKGNFEVAETCSGVRFLIASVALGALFANISFKSWKRRLAVIALAIIIPVIANGFRAYGIVMIAHLSNMKYAVGADHIIFGWVFFSVVIIMLILIGMTFSDRHVGDHDIPAVNVGERSASRNGVVGFMLGAAVVAAILPAYAHILISAQGEPSDGPRVAVHGAPGWQTPFDQRRVWSPVFANSDGDDLAVFGMGTAEISVYVAHYTFQGPGRELVQYANSVAGAAPWGVSRISTGEIAIDGVKVQYQESRIVANPMARTAWLWYSIDGTVTNSRYVAKLLTARSKLMGRGGEGSVLVISIDDNRTGGPPRVALEQAVRDLLAESGSIEAYINAALTDEHK